MILNARNATNGIKIAVYSDIESNADRMGQDQSLMTPNKFTKSPAQ
jgi:hypothetical protein